MSAKLNEKKTINLNYSEIDNFISLKVLTIINIILHFNYSQMLKREATIAL